MNRYKVVLDDMEAAARRSKDPVVRKLKFGISFSAESQEQAETWVREGASPALGRWHVEPVEDTGTRA